MLSSIPILCGYRTCLGSQRPRFPHFIFMISLYSSLASRPQASYPGLSLALLWKLSHCTLYLIGAVVYLLGITKNRWRTLQCSSFCFTKSTAQLRTQASHHSKGVTISLSHTSLSLLSPRLPFSVAHGVTFKRSTREDLASTRPVAWCLAHYSRISERWWFKPSLPPQARET